ncbi:DUF4179 domain-containing protein [Brevibacillus sp. NRS-1366]|uniref:DUF4179 domain-containing protein n=1 Tax=Brevibacillus sp. NRS-1366 TaxID=3233899 RepID=UPI003D1B72D5
MQEDNQTVDQQVALPLIDPYIRNGIHQAKQLQQKRRRMRWVRLGSGLAACSFLLALFFSIKLSPAVAAYVSHIPGMEKLVELISDDRGLQRAAENDMVQNIGASASHNGVSFTIDQVLMDQKRMLVFYTMKAKEKHKLSVSNVELFDSSGKNWEYGISWSSGDLHETNVIRDRLDIYVGEMNEVPEVLIAKITPAIDSVALDTPLSVTFPIDKTKYISLDEKVYPVMKQVEVDGQRFTIEQIAVFPTQTEVSIRFDPDNTKHVFDFDQLRLVDEKGQTFAFWGNGVPYRDNGPNGVVYHLESMYFVQPEKLYLKASGIRAIDKDKLQVVIDAKQQTLEKAPDSQLQLTALRQNEDVVGMDFTLAVQEQDLHRHYSLLSELTDDVGNEYEHVQSTSSVGNKKTTHSYGYLFKRKTNKGAPSSYQFTLNNYPVRLLGDFSVQVK